MTVLIGIAVKGRAVAGVIYQPYYNYQAGPDAVLGRIIWGIVGLGNLSRCFILLWLMDKDAVVLDEFVLWHTFETYATSTGF